MPCTTTYTYSSANPRIQTKILGKGTYNIMVQGGAGGIGHWNACGCCTQSGGQGATEQAAFYLATQTTVSFVVGGDGLRGNCAGGGGGASVVWIGSYTNPLIEAGGGGGGGWIGIGGCATLASGLGSTHASSGQSFNCGCTFSSGATGGTGGAACCGGGGAGAKGVGGNQCCYVYGGGRHFKGGCGWQTSSLRGCGGYGGGGGGGHCGGGGGGGYNGGTGGFQSGGGGGGSFISCGYGGTFISAQQSSSSTGGSVSFTFVSVNNVTCYLPGTLILTTKGEVAVEHLKIGDQLPTLSGQDVPIQWLGKQKFMGFFTAKEKSPVHFHAGSLGDGLPKRDLYVSAGHSMKLGEYLVDARLLVNGVTITQHHRAEQIEYYHIDLGEHHCILAEGSWAESYAECNENRDTFYNAADFYESHPYHLTIASLEKCLPHVADHNDPRLSALFNELLAYIPHDRITTDADVHLLANGIRLDPYESNAQALLFRIPAGTSNLRFKSRTSSPCELGLPSDNRQLGFCIQRLSSHSEDGTFNLSLAPNHSKLLEGFHPTEGTVRRWTHGNALLPNSLLGDGTEEMILTVQGNPLARYHLSDVQAPKMEFVWKLRLVR